MPEPAALTMSPEEHLDQEWLVINGVKTAFSLGHRSEVGYGDALAYTDEIDSRLIRPTSPFRTAFEPAERVLFRQRAAAQSKQRGRRVTAVDAVNQELGQLRSEFEVSRAADADRIRRRIKRLEELRTWFANEEPVSEGQTIQGDAESAVQGDVAHKGVGYREFELEDERRLAVRVLHPDKGEAVTGVDMVYEAYRLVDSGPREARRLEVRLVALQYKSWDGEKLYLSSDLGRSGKPRLMDQVERACTSFCESGMCARAPVKAGGPGYFSMPRCAAYLRPTDRVQHGQGYRVSIGVYLPMCQIEEALEPTSLRSLSLEGRALRVERLGARSIGVTTFHELFERDMLGTEWMPAERLAELYTRGAVRLYADRLLMQFKDMPGSLADTLPWAS